MNITFMVVAGELLSLKNLLCIVKDLLMQCFEDWLEWF